MQFFNGCKTKAEAKALHKRLCKCLHPDRQGESDLFVAMQEEYHEWPVYKDCADERYLYWMDRAINALNEIDQLNKECVNLQESCHILTNKNNKLFANFLTANENLGRLLREYNDYKANQPKTLKEYIYKWWNDEK